MFTGAEPGRVNEPVEDRHQPATAPLFDLLQTMIERSFGMPHVVPSAAWFLIGDGGFRRFYGIRSGSRREDATIASGPGARLLGRPGSVPLRVALYYPDRLGRHLQRADPPEGLGGPNIQSLAPLG